MSDPLATVTRIDGQGMLTLRADLSDSTVSTAVQNVLGTDMPSQRQALFAGDNGAMWMSPDEALLLCPVQNATERAAALTKALDATHALVVNVSDARAVFAIDGPNWREVLGKLMPVDFSRDVFAPGQIRRSRLAQVAAAVWTPDGSSARLICFRSVAEYVEATLTTSAAANASVGYYN